MFDIIGDIHGYADELVALLSALGYRPRGDGFAHPAGRRVIFLGDLIDRGPAIARVLGVVRSMVDRGDAQAVIGNHEFTAIGYHTPDPDRPGAYLRERTPAIRAQLRATLEQLGDDFGRWVDWFRTLPPFLAVGGLRAVHACWENDAIATVGRAFGAAEGWTPALMARAARRDDPAWAAVGRILNGPEAELPTGVTYADFEDGGIRHRIRCRWFADPTGHTYASYAMTADGLVCPAPLASAVVDAARPYPANAPPLFVGHYWLREAVPTPLAGNVACVDYSVAQDGALCGYRWDGEHRLSADRFTRVPVIRRP